MVVIEKIIWHIKRKFYSLIFFIRFGVYPFTTISGIKIPVKLTWSFSLLNALYNKQYEAGELNILIKTLQKSDKVLEIGTGLGLISAYCAKHIGDNNIKTYEANPLLEKSIRNLYSINNVRPDLNISLVLDTKKSVIFYVEPNDIWASSLIKLSETSIEMFLETTDINEVIKEFKPNYMVIDIEGAEYELLPQIDLSLVNKIQIELHEKFLGKEKILFLFKLLEGWKFVEKKELTTDEQFFFFKDE